MQNYGGCSTANGGSDFNILDTQIRGVMCWTVVDVVIIVVIIVSFILLRTCCCEEVDDDDDDDIAKCAIVLIAGIVAYYRQ